MQMMVVGLMRGFFGVSYAAIWSVKKVMVAVERLWWCPPMFVKESTEPIFVVESGRTNKYAEDKAMAYVCLLACLLA